ncbi:tetratricopeptide repeat-containing sulfotransferase family protein [Thalassotalea agarivorans]|uniref:Tetratricopeptide repeat-containing protein n=1 Tax=Thalassotalea agarivorans TaxID=349064 RepID=A0A1I0DN57_THASX|nr:tetratricopeptide repeat-containing sulfotransferase family protein [Thalassotalea agarivorans]SET33771.1 Tetratricopeptide repeat-containing protein [Thalassotalea agarivorans]
MNTSSNQLNTLLKRAQSFAMEKRYKEAIEQAKEVLTHDKSNIDATMLLAICLDKQGDSQSAAKALASIIKTQPSFIAAYILLIQIDARHQAYESAARIAQSALKYAPQHPTLWLELSKALQHTNAHEKADNAYKNYLLHSASHPLLKQSLAAFFDNELAKSERLVREYLVKHPKDVSAIRLLAEIAINLGILGEAQTLLERALTIAPSYHLARLNYAHTLNKREKSALALKQIAILEKHQPNHLPVMTVKAAVLIKLGDYREAAQLYDEILQKQPSNPALWSSSGHAEKTLGNQEKAIAAYQKAIALNPLYGEPYWSLANLKTYVFDEQEIAQMKDCLRRLNAEQIDDKAHIHFSLGKALENKKAIDDAFYHYQQGNALKRKTEPYNANQTTSLVSRNKTFFSDFAKQSQQENQVTPIFIVGLPRSGSTLLEQVISSHSLVDGTKELPDIMAIARQLGNRVKKHDQDMYPTALGTLSLQALAELGSTYLDGTLPHRNNAPFFIDKMPNNFLHIGLIKTILPNAKIIDARRDPTATCFSCFKQLFATGQAYTNDLSDLKKYYQDYLELMAFWQEKYPQDVLTVQYENVVENTEQSIKEILKFIGLPFEQQCLDFHKNKRAVATASSEQVRQPINTKGLNAWLPFKPFLSEIIDIQSP